MKDDHHPPNLQTWIEPGLEARVVAWVLGEASPFEVAELERLVAEKPELAAYKRQVEAVHTLTRTAVRPDVQRLQLPPASRAKVLAKLGQPAKSGPQSPVALRVAKKAARRPAWYRHAMEAAACFLIIGVLASIIIPTLGSVQEGVRRSVKRSGEADPAAQTDRVFDDLVAGIPAAPPTGGARIARGGRGGPGGGGGGRGGGRRGGAGGATTDLSLPSAGIQPQPPPSAGAANESAQQSALASIKLQLAQEQGAPPKDAASLGEASAAARSRMQAALRNGIEPALGSGELPSFADTAAQPPAQSAPAANSYRIGGGNGTFNIEGVNALTGDGSVRAGYNPTASPAGVPSSPYTMPSGMTDNSFRFYTMQATTLDATGGLQVTPNVTGNTTISISGGTLSTGGTTSATMLVGRSDRTTAESVLRSASSSFSGGTFINKGTLVAAAGSMSAIGGIINNPPTFPSVGDGAGFRGVGDFFGGAGTANSTANLLRGNPIVAADTWRIGSANLTGSGNLTKAGAGTLTLSGGSIDIGGTSVSAGALVLGREQRGLSLMGGFTAEADKKMPGVKIITDDPRFLEVTNGTLNELQDSANGWIRAGGAGNRGNAIAPSPAAASLVAQGRAQFNGGDLVGARGTFDQILGKDGQNAEAQYFRSQIDKKLADAARDTREAVVSEQLLASTRPLGLSAAPAEPVTPKDTGTAGSGNLGLTKLASAAPAPVTPSLPKLTEDLDSLNRTNLADAAMPMSGNVSLYYVPKFAPDELTGQSKGMLGILDDAPAARPAPDLAAESKRKALAEIADAEVRTSTEAVSTFSLHVGDVSFKLAQTALAQGRKPDPAGVRPEEFYNAFDYGDPAPAVGEPVAARIEQAAHPVLQQRNLVRIALRVPAAGRSAGQPLRLTVLLDTSGSMERPDRVATVRAAMTALASLLGADDLVTLVGFARTPRLLAERVRGTEAAKLADIVARTPFEGGTNLEEALKLAGELARRQQADGAQNRIVLLTDGAANLGNADPERLAQQIAALRQSGLTLDACGVGADGLDDEVLEALARKADGRYYLLNRPEDADAGFARQLAGAFRPAAENVKVQVRFNPERVASYRLIGFEQHRLQEQDFRNDAVTAAQLAAEEAAVALYQVEVRPDGTGELGDVAVRFRESASGNIVEHTWPILHDPAAPAFDRASPTMQLAGTAALLAEKLRGGAVASLFRLGELAPAVNALRGHYASEPRVQELVTMFGQARRLYGE